MWHFIILTGILLLHKSTSEVIVAINGNDVKLTCNINSTTQQISKILCKRGDGTIYVVCQGFTACENHTTGYSKGRDERIIRVLDIPNVSLDHEDEYTCTITSNQNKLECTFNLTVNVPPTGLVLTDKHGEELPQNKMYIDVAEGKNKTIVCKTNTSVKPVVDLQWMIPNGLHDISEYSEQIQDEHDERLFVSTRTLNFTPNYEFNEDISLACKVVNSSLEYIQTSIHIKEGAITTTNENPRTSSEESQLFTGSAGTFEGSDALSTPVLSSSTKEIDPKTPYTKNQLYIIAGGSGAVILLLLVAVVGGMIVSKKIAVKRSHKEESTGDAPQSRPSESRGALPSPPSDQSLIANHLPDRQPSPTRSFRPAPPIPPDIPMRQMVPVSDDTTGSSSDNNRWRGPTSRGTSASIPVTHSQRGLDTDMEYDMLNDMEYDVLNMECAVVDKTSSKAHAFVPHVYRETTDGLAEYALVSRPKMGKNALQPRFRNTEQLDAEFEYAVVDKSHRTGRESVPHVYTQTMSGLEEYAVVNKPKDRKKRQSEVRHTTAPGDFEAEYAVVDKWQKS